MYARNNNQALEFVPDNIVSAFQDTDINPFIQVPEIQVPFIDSSYSIIDGVVTPPTLDYLKSQVKSRVAEARYFKEVSGIKLPNGSVVSTTRESQAQLSSVYSSMKNGLVTSVDWKNSDGTWSILTIVELEVIAKAVSLYVSSCFTSELTHNNDIDALTTADDLYTYDVYSNYPSNGFIIPEPPTA